MFWLTQAPNTFKYISTNKRAMMKVSRKTVHNKVCLTLGKKVLLYATHPNVITQSHYAKACKSKSTCF